MSNSILQNKFTADSTSSNPGTSNPGAASRYEQNLEKITVVPLVPPLVHEYKHGGRITPKLVEFKLPFTKQKQMHGSVESIQLTFNGASQGPLLVVYEGDYVELNPVSLDSDDTLSFEFDSIKPETGEFPRVQTNNNGVLYFQAKHKGMYTYQCSLKEENSASADKTPIEGALIVLPKSGLKDESGEPLKYHKVFFVGDDDFNLMSTNYGIHPGALLDAFGKVDNTYNGDIPCHTMLSPAGNISVLIVHAETTDTTF